MPDQDEEKVPSAPLPESSGQTRPPEPSPPPDDDLMQADDRGQGPSESPYQPSSGNIHVDNAEPNPKGSKAKTSDTLRRSQACLACRKRKLRCDAKKPTCTRCEKAWLSYHPPGDGSEHTAPPPCEYDTSFLAKIFKRESSSDPQSSAASQPSAVRLRDSVHGDQYGQILEMNEQLRSHIESHSGDFAPNKRLRSSDDDEISTFAPRSSLISPPTQSQSALTRRDDGPVLPSKPSVGSIIDPLSQSRPSTIMPSSSTQIASRPIAVPTWAGPPHYTKEPDSTPTLETTFSAQPIIPPMPSRQTLDRLIEACQREAWLFSAINGYALSDVAALIENTPSPDLDQLKARALMMATVAIGLPLLAAGFPNGISSSPSCKDIDDTLRRLTNLNLVRLGEATWLPKVIKLFAGGARILLNQAQEVSSGFMTFSAFIVRLLLVEISHGELGVRSAQTHLGSAAAEARLMHLHSSTSRNHPRISAGLNRPSRLASALCGLMQGKDESYIFWSLFLHDCFQSCLAMLPSLIECTSIRTPFPRRVEVEATEPAQHSSEVVVSYLHRRRGLPRLEASDDSMSLLIKVSLVLDQCCEYADNNRQDVHVSRSSTSRSPAAQDERENAFVAAHESIRNSRMMLSHFDDRTIARSDKYAGSSAIGVRALENLVATLVLHDKIRFAAEVTHHLAVLSLFETAINVKDPFLEAGEASSMICNAAVWLSRLANMVLPNTTMLYALPSFCSTAFFIAARWLLFLQEAQLDQFHADISTLVLALSKRGACFDRDYSLARAVVALKREYDTYRRICISPFTWTIEAVSEFIPIPRQDASRGRPMPPQESDFVSIATLAASIEDAAVFELANSARALLG